VLAVTVNRDSLLEFTPYTPSSENNHIKRIIKHYYYYLPHRWHSLSLHIRPLSKRKVVTDITDIGNLGAELALQLLRMCEKYVIILTFLSTLHHKFKILFVSLSIYVH